MKSGGAYVGFVYLRVLHPRAVREIELYAEFMISKLYCIDAASGSLAFVCIEEISDHNTTGWNLWFIYCALTELYLKSTQVETICEIHFIRYFLFGRIWFD